MPNPFRPFWDAGYRRLVPVLPPDAAISDRSSLSRGIGLPGKDPRGKAVGVRGRDGLWSGFDWVRHECDENDLERWAIMGAGVGIKTGAQEDGTWLVGVDADTLADRHAATIATEITATLGSLPTRIGRAPKALYVVRLSGPLKYSRIDFEDGVADLARVEILSEGRQFVAAGIHPATREPYRWTAPLPPFSLLPIHAPEELA